MSEIEESTVEKLTNKINIICFLVERLNKGEKVENLQSIIERSYTLLPEIKELLQKLDRDCR
jgi:uncharacterized protein with WD repeat